MKIATWLLAHSKYLALVLGVAAGFPLILVRRNRLGLKNAGGALLVSIYFTVLSLAATMLLAVIEALLSGSTPNLGAVSVMGVYLFAPFGILAAAKVFRWKKEDAFDLYALYAVPSLFLMRINCLISGCCLGKHIGSSSLRFPTREMEMGLYAVLFSLFLLRDKDKNQRGTLFPFLMLTYGVFRFIIEWFREGSGGIPLHLSHLWAVLIAVVGYAWYTERRKRAEGQKKH